VASPVDDLKRAQAVGHAVEVELVDGETLFTSVHELDEAAGVVTFHAPQSFSDVATTRDVPLGQIVSVTVTDVGHS
jgi:hypothetical protein